MYDGDMPQPGQVVTIISGHESYVLGQEGWVEERYEDVVVIASEKFDPHNTFRFLVPESRVQVRRIHMRNVEKLISGNSTYKKIKPRKATNRTTKQVLSSKGQNSYTVVLEDGIAVSCTCPGFTYRRNCRHLKEAERS